MPSVMKISSLTALTYISVATSFLITFRRTSVIPERVHFRKKYDKLSEQHWHRVQVKCRMAQGNKDNGPKSTENPYYVGMNAYEILNIEKGADKKAVKSAYRKLVSMWHPDKFPDDEKKKKEGGYY